MSYYHVKCIKCGKELENPSQYERIRELCEICVQLIKEKEKKVFGWFIYKFLKIQKDQGKFIIPGEEYTQDKYGLQRIFINKITNEVLLEFYFGNSMIHRPKLRIPLEKVEEYKEELLDMIRVSNLSNYTRDGRQNKVMDIYETLKKEKKKGEWIG